VTQRFPENLAGENPRSRIAARLRRDDDTYGDD
jgi:hypothetical protein